MVWKAKMPGDLRLINCCYLYFFVIFEKQKNKCFMKNIYISLITLLLSSFLAAQSPQAFKYQAIARDISGNTLSFWDIGLRISILEKGQEGPALYSETHKVRSNVYGLINLVIGEGQLERGSFKSIKWGENKHYLKIEMDTEGGNDYKEVGVSQLYAVPYALYAEQAGQLIEPEEKQEKRNDKQQTGKKASSVKKQPARTTSGRDVLPNSRIPANSHSYLNVKGNVGIGNRTPVKKLDVTGEIASSLGYFCDGEEGLSDSLNLVCDINFNTSKMKYKTLVFDGGILTYISESSAWVDTVGSYIDTVFQCGDALRDIDGNAYNTVLIGDQCWMKENLRVSHYPNGDAIPLVTDNSAWGALEDYNTHDAYCFYNNDPNSEYGALYTYAAAIADNWLKDHYAGQGICPDGWHLPTNDDWAALGTYLGGNTVAGGKMKETGTSHWSSPNTGATNESGFTGLPGGYRMYNNGGFYDLGTYGVWWTADEYNSTFSLEYFLYKESSELGTSHSVKSYGYSVRCIKDD